MEHAGFRIGRWERYGGWRTFMTDWAVTLAGPVLRRTRHVGALERVGEWDAGEFQQPQATGRYVLFEAVAQ